MSLQRRETKAGVRWIARWRDKGGKQHSRSFTRRADAKTFLADIETRKARGADVNPRKITVLEIYNGWLDSRPLRPSSRTLYEHTRDNLLVPLHNYPATTLTPSEVADWAQQLRTNRSWIAANDTGLTEAGVIQAQRHLRSAMKWGVDEGILAKNPVRVTVKDRPVEPAQLPSAADIEAVVTLVRTGGAPYTETTRSKYPERHGKPYIAKQRARPEIADMMLAATYTGLRISELAGLNVGEVDYRRGQIHVRKQLGKIPPRQRVDLKTSNSRRDVPIPPELLPVLERYTTGRDPQELLFTTKTGKPLNTSQVAVVVKRAAEQVGAPAVHFHALRHYYASTLLTAGVPVQDVAAVMGHTVAMTMSTYAHVMAGYQHRVAAAISGCGISVGSPALRVVGATP